MNDWKNMTPEEIREDVKRMADLMNERRYMVIDLDVNNYYREPITKIDITSPEITIDPKEYMELSKLDKNTMYGRTGTIIIDEGSIANGSWLDWFDSKNIDGFLRVPTFIEPLIPNRFDLMERAKNDPKFECHQRIKEYKADPSKRKASKLARKARRNNK